MRKRLQITFTETGKSTALIGGAVGGVAAVLVIVVVVLVVLLVKRYRKNSG